MNKIKWYDYVGVSVFLVVILACGSKSEPQNKQPSPIPVNTVNEPSNDDVSEQTCSQCIYKECGSQSRICASVPHCMDYVGVIVSCAEEDSDTESGHNCAIKGIKNIPQVGDPNPKYNHIRQLVVDAGKQMLTCSGKAIGKVCHYPCKDHLPKSH